MPARPTTFIKPASVTPSLMDAILDGAPLSSMEWYDPRVTIDPVLHTLTVPLPPMMTRWGLGSDTPPGLPRHESTGSVTFELPHVPYRVHVLHDVKVIRTILPPNQALYLFRVLATPIPPSVDVCNEPAQGPHAVPQNWEADVAAREPEAEAMEANPPGTSSADVSTGVPVDAPSSPMSAWVTARELLNASTRARLASADDPSSHTPLLPTRPLTPMPEVPLALSGSAPCPLQHEGAFYGLPSSN
ncbi:hypothetical protein D9615_003486 [Tricholomella constricta]|uniref:Uncharacterized protein n=1 Tax=Tricholomella constricta TaxID=117010 RepID=A0A8H5M892_9AGAR|nr:hypothetical protein D9615_003486 [Tricholomella constricta]